MRWRQGRRSSNIEDRRGQGRYSGGTPSRLPRGAKPGGVLLLILLAALLFGQDPGQMLDLLAGDGSDTGTTAPPTSAAPQDELGDFISVVLGDTEDTWSQLFGASGEAYRPARLVLYEDVTQTACGLGQAATGPFYCPGDQTVYLDLGFFRELQRMGAPGDFAMAYVIAHEIGHHIQRLVGTEQEVRRLQSRAGTTEANALSVRLELQADCYAGVWGHHADRQRNLLEEGDVEEGLAAAAAVGDDRLQRQAGRRVQPEAFTHGSSRQRMQWFQAGLQSGSAAACDTFNQ